MKLNPVDPVALHLPESRRSRKKITRAVEAFMESGHQAVELMWYPGEYSSAGTVQSCYGKAIARMKANCFVRMVEGRIYLIRKDVE